MWNKTCFLCTETETLDELRKPQKTYAQRKVYCNEKGVKRNEFYQAQAQGQRAEICVEIHKTEYQNETHISFNGTVYRIFKTYPTNAEKLEIIGVSLIT